MEKNRQVPSLGRIVHYTLTPANAVNINEIRRVSARNYFGNAVYAGDVFPMLITKVWAHGDPDAYVNGQVFLDGNDCLWVTSVKVGDVLQPGQAFWPPFVSARPLNAAPSEEELAKYQTAFDPDKGSVLSQEELHRKIPGDLDSEDYRSSSPRKYNQLAEDRYETSPVQDAPAEAPSAAKKR